MRTGVMVPNGIPGRPATAITAWAARAEELGFDAVGAIDRIAYDSVDPFVALSAAAAVTSRVELVTDLVVAPLRPAAVLAKQAASLDLLSGGRFTLGVGVGIRADDFALAGVPYARRGTIFTAQLAELDRCFGLGSEVGPGPVRPGGPQVLVGGSAELAAPRAARHGAGWTMAIGGPDQLAAGVEVVRQEWRRAGRTGTPRTMGMVYTAVGSDAREQVDRAVGGYYAWLGPDLVGWVLSTCAVGEDALARAVDEFAAAGADDLMITPCSADLGQLDRIAEVVVGLPVPA